MTEQPPRIGKRVLKGLIRATILCLFFGACALFAIPNSQLSDAWNPFKPLSVSDSFTPLTSWKLTRALGDPQACMAALQTGALAKVLPDFEESAQCHIRTQVSLSGVGRAQLKPVKTRCQTALRIAMWERHGIAPAAERHLGQEVREILHYSSYSCRQMRTGGNGAPRMSTHATAEAIDVSGFVLTDGARLTLLDGWDGTQAQAAFMRDVRDSACDWFRVTLGPDYNALHADHFHLQHTGWGLCR